MGIERENNVGGIRGKRGDWEIESSKALIMSSLTIHLF